MMFLYAYLAIGVAFVLATAKVRSRAIKASFIARLSVAVLVWPILACDMILTRDTYDWGDDA